MIDINNLAVLLVKEAMHAGEMSFDEARFIINFISE